MSEVYATPLVRQLAKRYAVDLAAVTGTGVGGRVTAGDVRQAADVAITPRLDALERSYARVAVATPSGRKAVAARSSFTGAEIMLDPWARNPRVDDVRQALPHIYNQVIGHSSPPTLFASGDLPAFVASGAEPRLLLQLPWQARHPAAAADGATFARMLEDYTNDDLSAQMELGEHEGNHDYLYRVQDWIRSGDDAGYVG
jgi:hypothetical protein